MADTDGYMPHKPRPLPVSRALGALGDHVATWRKLHRLSASTLATRAGVSRDTLRAIEQGRGGASLDNAFRVLRVLGVMDRVVEAADPYETEVGRLRAHEILPQRVHS